jgi:hypothetical protein
LVPILGCHSVSTLHLIPPQPHLSPTPYLYECACPWKCILSSLLSVHSLGPTLRVHMVEGIPLRLLEKRKKIRYVIFFASNKCHYNNTNDICPHKNYILNCCSKFQNLGIQKYFLVMFLGKSPESGMYCFLQYMKVTISFVMAIFVDLKNNLVYACSKVL